MPRVSEFGGDYEDCGNETFFCLAGPLDIIIPKSMSAKQWQYLGLSCKSVDEHGGDVIHVTCSSSRMYHTGTSFSYSRSRGVLSFGNSRIGGYTWRVCIAWAVWSVLARAESLAGISSKQFKVTETINRC